MPPNHSIIQIPNISLNLLFPFVSVNDVCFRSSYNKYNRQSMDRREYTPVKTSKILTPITNTQATSTSKPQEYKPQEYPRQSDITRQYESLRQQVRSLQQQNRQLSGEADRLRYEKSIFENKYLQKTSFEQEAILQCQKEKNYQLELMRLKGEEDANRLRRDFQSRLDELHRELKARDYNVRELSQKNAYLESKAGELRRAGEELEGEQIRARDTAATLEDRRAQEEFRKKKLQVVQDELQGQRNQMEAEIHILLDIQAEKSQAISSLQLRLRGSQDAERTLHEKLTVLTENFAALEQHVAIVKERLVSADLRNQQAQQQILSGEQVLASKEETVASLKEQQIRFRQQLQREQAREVRREREVGELITQNQRLFNELSLKQQRLHDLCISQGIDI